jgi:uncharacterized membrane protein YjgN (DUF898 family)
MITASRPVNGRAMYGDSVSCGWPSEIYGVCEGPRPVARRSGSVRAGLLLFLSSYDTRTAPGWSLETLIYAALFALVTYVVAWPYLAARLQQVVWTSTHLPGVSFRTEIRAWALFRLVLGNVVLVIVTCGLYWPFAAIALARYRINCMRVDSIMPLDAVAAGLHASPGSATGDGALDSFGLDLGI